MFVCLGIILDYKCEVFPSKESVDNRFYGLIVLNVFGDSHDSTPPTSTWRGSSSPQELQQVRSSRPKSGPKMFFFLIQLCLCPHFFFFLIPVLGGPPPPPPLSPSLALSLSLSLSGIDREEAPCHRRSTAVPVGPPRPSSITHPEAPATVTCSYIVGMNTRPLQS
jgi:hypothetical protein